MSLFWRQVIIISFLGITLAVIIGFAGVIIHIQALDFNNYWIAGRLILQGENPYSKIEFFAPPWLAIFLLPLLLLPLKNASVIWLVFNIISLIITIVISLKWLKIKTKVSKMMALPMAILMPGALFSYITGQISPIIGLALLFIAWQINTTIKWKWLFATAILVTTLKPHIVVFPLLLCILELVRSRNWKAFSWIFLGGAIVMVIAFIIIPSWLPSMISAWIRGDFRGGSPGLISPGYTGLREVGISFWIFLPLSLYALYGWWQKGLTPDIFALSLMINFLLIPYNRSYDFVLMIFPLLSLSIVPNMKEMWIFGLAVITTYVLPFTILSMLTPVLVVMFLLLKQVLYPPMVYGKIIRIPNIAE